jgi:hypothetical protein
LQQKINDNNIFKTSKKSPEWWKFVQSGHPVCQQGVIFNFRQWFENHRISAYLWATFFHPTSYVLILAKNWLGYIFGDFFTNSSGHPVCQRDENYCNLFKRGQRALFPQISDTG